MTGIKIIPSFLPSLLRILLGLSLWSNSAKSNCHCITNMIWSPLLYRFVVSRLLCPEVVRSALFCPPCSTHVRLMPVSPANESTSATSLGSCRSVLPPTLLTKAKSVLIPLAIKRVKQWGDKKRGKDVTPEHVQARRDTSWTPMPQDRFAYDTCWAVLNIYIESFVGKTLF